MSSTSTSTEEIEKIKKELEKLKKENQILRKELIVARESITQKDSILGQNLIEASDYETLQGFFHKKANKEDGTISLNDIEDLYFQLDEPLTLEEAKIVKLNITKSKDGKRVSFNDFITHWVKSHTNLKKKSSQQQRSFKMVGNSKAKSINTKSIITKEVGNVSTLGYRVKFYIDNVQISPWHDIPLYASGFEKDSKTLNFVCEIPKWTRAKYEIYTRELFNPIRQDVKNGKLRNYQHGDMMFNYGALPQTWEDPSHITKETGCRGDNDPIDVIELGTMQIKTVGVVPVKVLGVLALIDDGETDWKVIAIQTADPLSLKLNDVDDVEKHIPGAIHAIREYLRIYKVCTGKEPNKFGFKGKCMGRDYALKIIEETHAFWKNLRKQEKDTVHTPLEPKKFDWSQVEF